MPSAKTRSAKRSARSTRRSHSASSRKNTRSNSAVRRNMRGFFNEFVAAGVPLRIANVKRYEGSRRAKENIQHPYFLSPAEYAFGRSKRLRKQRAHATKFTHDPNLNKNE